MNTITIAVVLVQTWVASAWASVPDCLDHGRLLSIDNSAVEQLKASAPIGQPIRAHAFGHVRRLFADQTNSKGITHKHFEIALDGTDATLEVVYSEDDGAMPSPGINASIEACGDFINSSAPNGGYGASPSGAIIHWVHQTDTPAHDAGFVTIDGVLYGYGGTPHVRH